MSNIISQNQKMSLERKVRELGYLTDSEGEVEGQRTRLERRSEDEVGKKVRG